MSTLALYGGSPVRSGRPWPAWPQYDDATEREVLAALRSRRWAISWPSDGTWPRERRFAAEFARYNDVPYCVTVDHGSSALVVALEALDIGPGDEVIVPAMTWVAPASTVLRTGALPVLVDIDPRTGCITPEAVRSALSDRTKAVIAIHLACSVADLDGILEATGEAGIPLIEDCAQAHGARWRGRAVGTFGVIGAFSFQAGKVLTGGEGGAVITSDERLYRRAQQLRADSRRYPDHEVAAGEWDLVECGEVMGSNYCIPELSAALLLDQLPRLDAQHEYREKVAREVELGLTALGDFGPIPLPPQATKRSVYEYGIQFRPGTFGPVPAARVAAAVSAELGMAWWPPDPPLYDSTLMRPHTKRRFAQAWTEEGRRRSFDRDFSGCRQYAETTLLCHHAALLGDTSDAECIVRAVQKVRDNQEELLVDP